MAPDDQPFSAAEDEALPRSASPKSTTLWPRTSMSCWQSVSPQIQIHGSPASSASRWLGEDFSLVTAAVRPQEGTGTPRRWQVPPGGGRYPQEGTGTPRRGLVLSICPLGASENTFQTWKINSQSACCRNMTKLRCTAVRLVLAACNWQHMTGLLASAASRMLWLFAEKLSATLNAPPSPVHVCRLCRSSRE